MKTFSKQELVAKISDVANMNANKLMEFGIKVSTSDIDAKAKYYLYEAIDLRQEELMAINNSMVVDGDTNDCI